MTRLLTPMLAVLLAGVPAMSARADKPDGFAERVERIGKLPAELVKAKKADSDVIEALFLAALTRLPTDEEKEHGAKHLARAAGSEPARVTAARDLAWAVVNSKEFLKLHGLDGDAAAAVKLLNTLSAKWPIAAKERN
jgi:hypothetical protein